MKHLRRQQVRLAKRRFLASTGPGTKRPGSMSRKKTMSIKDRGRR